MLLLGYSPAHVGGGVVGCSYGLGREVERVGRGPSTNSGPRGRRGEKRRGGPHLRAKERERVESPWGFSIQGIVFSIS
jgi:hypothetical protein